jgi:serine/threonine-protein kinase
MAHAENHEAASLGALIDSRYRVTGVLGRGSIGCVYRAEEIATQRTVALKMVRPELQGCVELRQRLEREAFATAHAQHANCVSIWDVGATEDGRLYIVMEHIDGVLLADSMSENGRLGIGRSLHIAAHVLRGLCHVHDGGVVHRDLKPENVFLARVGQDRDFAKILDFGLAKLVGAAAAGQPQLTRAGFAVGTPTYMAPEIMTRPEIDARADLYSLSIMLYEMITGRPPFVAAAKEDVLRMHLGADIPPFAESAPGLAVPAAVEHVIRRGLAKTPETRIQTAAEYLGAVETLLVEVNRAPQTTKATLLFVGIPRAVQPRPALPQPRRIAGPQGAAGRTPNRPPWRQLGSLRSKKRKGWIVAGLLAGLLTAILVRTAGDGPSADRVQAVIAAWREAGFVAAGFRPVDGTKLSGGDCASGTVQGIEVTLCQYESDQAVRQAKLPARRWIGSARGKVAISDTLLLVVADRKRGDPSGETTEAIVTVFERTATRDSMVAMRLRAFAAAWVRNP